MQPRHAVGLGIAAGRLPGVEAEVVVIAAGGEEEDVAGRAPAGDVARLEDDVEPEDADVEVAHPVDVGRAQVHVADAHAGVDGLGRALARDDRTLRAHLATSILSALAHGSRITTASPSASTGTPAASARARTTATSSGRSSSTVQCSS